MRFQPIYDIAEVCAQKGITHVVLCPGSRCAPLTIAFARHPALRCITITDERSAGFIALGIAQATLQPTVLVCTSGTAAYNFAPVVAEAFYQQVPLIVITADRPKEWIDQWDGQTIHQEHLYGHHAKSYFELPEAYDRKEDADSIYTIINQGIDQSRAQPRGPVHINAPFKEPLYPAPGEMIQFSSDLPLTSLAEPPELSQEEVQSLTDEMATYSKVLLVVGQQNEWFSDSISQFCQQHYVPVVGDVISNLHDTDLTIVHTDALLGQCPEDVKRALRPELLITCGKSVISKQLKLFLRAHKPAAHWHIQPHDGPTPDPFRSLTKVIQSSPAAFFNKIHREPKTDFDTQKRNNYLQVWTAEENRTNRAIHNFFSQPQLSEFALVHHLLQHLPDSCRLHLANSMSVRYANFIGLRHPSKEVRVFSNRGTSGIDGCTSTAVGQALVSSDPVFLVTGDLAFFYDRNAFWHNHKLPNLRIILLNNHGGSIFGVIDGPRELPEFEDYFITRQALSARYLCQEFDFDHLKLDSLKKWKNLWKDFLEFDGRTKVLEIECSQASVRESMNQFKHEIRKSYGA